MQSPRQDDDGDVEEVKSEELKKEVTAKDDVESDKEGSQQIRHDNNEKSRNKHRSNRRDGRSRDGRDRGDRRDDRDRGDRRENKRDDRRRHHPRDRRQDDRSRRPQDDRRGGRGDRRHRQEKEYEDYRRRKYGDSREWGKVSAESLKDVKTDSTLPSTFDSTIAKQLAAQREKRKLLWGKKEEGESSSQKTVWGSGSIRNDESGEQTAKFLKLMGVKDVTADNVKDYQKTDESVLRSTEMLDSMETEYEKSRYMQHINKGIGLGLVQFKPPS